jgi:hypothetical protein
MLGFIIRYISQHKLAVAKSKLTSYKTRTHAKVYKIFVIIGVVIAIIGVILNIIGIFLP